MKKTLKPMLLLLGVMAISSMMLLSCDSYERRMERLNKVASEFKATLGPSNQILAERIDSTAQKVFYLEPDEEGYGDASIKNIKVHDYTTNETKSILPESGSIEDFEFCDMGYGSIEYYGSKIIKDRLFFKIWSGCMWKYGATGVFYVNIRDNSLHYVESCDDATFLENGEIEISKYYDLGEYGELENKQYTLSTSLSDEAYADNRQEQKRIEERLAEEWRNRDIERIIKFDYTVYNDHRFDDHIGNLNRPLIPDMVHTQVLTIPNNKVWVFKRFSYSGYGFHSPVPCYHKVKNGYCDNPFGPPIKDGQIFYPGQYMFSIKDIDCNSDPGHRTAKLVFTEQVY